MVVRRSWVREFYVGFLLLILSFLHLTEAVSKMNLPVGHRQIAAEQGTVKIANDETNNGHSSHRKEQDFPRDSNVI